jgi:hypothetical protein
VVSEFGSVETMIRTLLISLVVLLGLLAALAVVRDPARWPEVEAVPYQGEAADVVTRKHSTAALAQLVREPQNTWSNLAFVVAGAFLVATRRARSASVTGFPLIAVGVGSFLYHASASMLLRQLDVGAMYWLFGVVAIHCVAIVVPRLRPVIDEHAIGFMLGALVLAGLLTLSRNIVVLGFKPLSLQVATTVASAALLLTLADVIRRRESVAAAFQFLGIVTLFGAAVYFQVSDRPGGTLYRPAAAFQAHAVWHVLAAIAFAWAVTLLDRYGPEAARA